jgi:beta-lactam-binding protein with PASTA domain
MACMWGLGGFGAANGVYDWVFGPVDPGTATRHPRRGEVPDVRGMDLDDARLALLSEGFHAAVHRLEDDPAPVMGIVVAQIPAPGTTWSRARKVQLSVLHPSIDQDVDATAD